MFKKLVFIMSLLCIDCFAMLPDEEFLDFVNKSRGRLSSVRTSLQQKAEESGCSFKSIASRFLEKYAPCFDGTPVKGVSESYSSSTLHTAAQMVGIAYLEEGLKKSSKESLEKALAWFKSIPVSFQQVDISPTSSDSCVVNYKLTIESELQRISEQKQKLQQLREQAIGLF